MKDNSKTIYITNNYTIQDTNNIMLVEPRKMSQERITVVSGYIPLRERIKNFMIAGENLEEYRKLTYSYADDDQVEENKIKTLTEKLSDLNCDADEIMKDINDIKSKIKTEKMKQDDFNRKKIELFNKWQYDEKIKKEAQDALQKENIPKEEKQPS